MFPLAYLILNHENKWLFYFPRISFFPFCSDFVIIFRRSGTYRQKKKEKRKQIHLHTYASTWRNQCINKYIIKVTILKNKLKKAIYIRVFTFYFLFHSCFLSFCRFCFIYRFSTDIFFYLNISIMVSLAMVLLLNPMRKLKEGGAAWALLECGVPTNSNYAPESLKLLYRGKLMISSKIKWSFKSLQAIQTLTYWDIFLLLFTFCDILSPVKVCGQIWPSLLNMKKKLDGNIFCLSVHSKS